MATYHAPNNVPWVVFRTNYPGNPSQNKNGILVVTLLPITLVLASITRLANTRHGYE